MMASTTEDPELHPEDIDPTLGNEALVIDPPTDEDAADGEATGSLGETREAEASGFAQAFDIDDTIRASRMIQVSDGSQLIVSFEALIDWRSGTDVAIKLVSRTLRQRPTAQVYPLRTTFFMTIETKKLGRTIPPLDVSPMENDWPTYGLNLHSAHLNYGKYSPGSPWVARANHVSLTFSGARLIRATGEPRDNKTHRIIVHAAGGFGSGIWFTTEAKSAIRGGK